MIELQLLNVPINITSKLFGIVTSPVILTQSENAFGPRLFMLELILNVPSKPLHLENAWVPTLFTESGTIKSPEN